MGTRLILAAFFILFGVLVDGGSICEVEGCGCSKIAANWQKVNCTFGPSQDVQIKRDMLHANLMEVYIINGNSVQFLQGAFGSVPALSLVSIYGVNLVQIDTKSFQSINSSQLLVEIKDCDEVTVKTGAFDNMQALVDFEVYNCNAVSIGKSAFNRLLSSKFENIENLDFSENTFELQNQGSIGKHGPVTDITIENATINEIPKETFFSSLNEVKIHNSQIQRIHKEAFRATTISSIRISNTSIGTVEASALLGRSLVTSFLIDKCTIERLEPGAIMAGFNNFAVQHSRITVIGKNAVSSTVANVEIVGNEIADFHAEGFKFEKWNKITFKQNIIKNLESSFIDVLPSEINKNFTFKANDLYNVEENALSFMSKLDDTILYVDDNYFNTSCDCSMDDWLMKVTNGSNQIDRIKQTSFCKVSDYMAKCLILEEGLINITNFTKLSCNKTIKCEPYKGEVRLINTTSKIFFPDDSNRKTWLIVILTVTGVLIALIVCTFAVMLVRGGRWLKRKGYFRNIHYNPNETSHDDENTMVTMDYNETLEMPDELTLDFLQQLSQKLDDPSTHQQASEMIERLYEMFIVDDNYDNNRHEDAHLYEELANMPPPPYQEEDKPQNNNTNGARSILNLLEERLNFDNNDEDSSAKPSMTSEYSEPSDAAVHLYSELKQNQNTGTVKKSNLDLSNRPLPSQPQETFMEAGPSKSNH